MDTPTPTTRRQNISFMGDLYERIQRAAAEESAARGKTVAVSTLIREVMEEYLSSR